ncbi:hypothetical protein [Natranaerofaba carboxydovora]|uniref:hypothetical protein n=1 Tax=Natranaerofaba carboxydovora TaxID=2742683 RepID=UPI001F14035C|nr:hypothetical protein [Natranaerofaba carboxydovora]UMZ74387.1 hypothetical protein ACONDI_01975 [Natranaerofaba carboxydovora]
MKLCPDCKSDNIENASSLGLRVFACLVLIFIIPFGFLFAWLPFVLSYKYRCNLCGKLAENEEFLNIDWREKDEILKEYTQMEKELSDYLGNWVKDDNNDFYKIVKGRGQFLALKLINKNLLPYLITGLENNKTLKVKEMSGFKIIERKSNVHGLYKPPESENLPADSPQLTSLGEEVLTQEEFLYITKQQIEDVKKWLESEKVDDIKIIINPQ